MTQGRLHLLIADDEPNIADRLYCIFKPFPQLEVYRVYNGVQAIALMKTKKIDIALLDISMPKVSGMEVMQELKAVWPEAKVVFLTGFKSFDYVYESIRYDHVKYILKSEGEDAIMDAVNEQIERIGKERDRAALLDKASMQLKQLEPVLLQERLLRIIRGECEPTVPEAEAMQEARLLEAPFHFLLCELTGGAADGAAYVILKQLLGLLKEKTQGYSGLGFLGPDNNQLYCLFGSGPERPQLALQLHAMMEQLQNLVFEVHGCRISFALSEEPIMLEAVRDTYIALNRVVKLHFGMELLYAGGQTSESRVDIDEITKLAHELKMDLYQGDEGKFTENCALLPRLLTGKNGSQNTMMLWHHMSVILLEISACYSVQMTQADSKIISNLVTNAYLLTDAAELVKVLERCGTIIFGCQRQSWAAKTEQAVNQINHYIENNLDGDLSLGELAGKVFLNPSYFSRLYKQVMGQNLSDFINAKRMDRAKELLAGTTLKIGDIALQVGFDSSSYFTVFFKKNHGISPAEYRERAQHGGRSAYLAPSGKNAGEL